MYRTAVNFEKDYPDPMKCICKGCLPQWLIGSLFRNGPGLFRAGSDTYNHLFDGMAVLQKYTFTSGGLVFYQNRILDTETYRCNTRAGKIVVDEIGTMGKIDVTKPFFRKYFDFFLNISRTDNTNVNVLLLEGKLYALTETNYINVFDPETLEKLERIDLQKYLDIHLSTAHPLFDNEGTLWNVGSSFSVRSTYNVFRIPKPVSNHEMQLNPFTRSELVGMMPSQKGGSPSYYHSFGMSQNYIVLVEQPLEMPLLSFALAKIRKIPLAELMKFNSHSTTRFRVFCKKTYKELPVKFVASGFFVFHHVNTYEERGCLVVDVCSTHSSLALQSFKLSALQEMEQSSFYKFDNGLRAMLRRFVLPLSLTEDNSAEYKPLIGINATVIRRSTNTIYCTPDDFNDKCGMEMPRINPGVAGSNYRYAYGIDVVEISERESDQFQLQVVKFDFIEQRVICWTDDKYLTGEPAFVPAPTAHKEDQGVLLVPLMPKSAVDVSALVVIDAEDFAELARVYLPQDVVVPYTFHGTFLFDHQQYSCNTAAWNGSDKQAILTSPYSSPANFI